MKILFICLGNICRSPMAEAIFNHKVKHLGPSWGSESAGTGHWHIGERPDHRTLTILERHGVESTSHAHNIGSFQPEDFDFWVVMDDNNRSDTLAKFPDLGDKLVLMRDYDPVAPGNPVPDPYWGDLPDFQEVYNILDRSIDRFIELQGDTSSRG